MSRVAPLFSWQRAVTSAASDATRNERHVALQISLYMSAAGDGAWPGNARLATETTMGKSTVREALRGLDTKGWLIREINRGRGNTNLYEARIPRSYYDRLDPGEKRQILAVFGLDRLADDEITGEAVSVLPAAPEPATKRSAGAGENRQAVAVLPTAKTASHERENRQDRDAKTAGGLAPTRSGPDQEQTAAAELELAGLVDGAAAVELDERLNTIRAGVTLRREAHADPQRALAWLELAATEADRNPSGFVLAGIRSGEWPGIRGPVSTSRDKMRAWVDETAWKLGRDAAHEVLDDWDLELDSSELEEWHQAIDEACETHERSRQIA